MGLRFRKSIKLGKHFSVNLSPKGVGYSYGVKGARHSVSADGRHRTTYSVPGTGLTYTTSSGNKSSHKTTSNHTDTKSNRTASRPTKAPNNNFTVLIIISILFFVSLIASCFLAMYGLMPDTSALFFFILSAVFFVLAFKSKWEYEHYINSFSEPPHQSPTSSEPASSPAEPLTKAQSVSHPRQEWYYVNTQTKKIHRSGCRYAPRAADSHCTITRDYTLYVNKGYTKCNYCNK